MTNTANTGNPTGPVSAGYLYQTLRGALLWAGLACMVGAAISPWYLRAPTGYSRGDVGTLGLTGMLFGPESLGPAKLHAAVGVALAITLWLCALGRVGANSDRVDAAIALMTALTPLALIASHAALTNSVGATPGVGLPLMLLSVAFNGVCAVKLRR
ncbi:hypothetical protein [Actinomyces qiguomingii]|uniref:hypothetical protein n=1 Tax=Actinomyces qiguomingii TaxID=2057800 RepID=UPI000FFF6417|nr:hypothetical protein [Actinomyces qiguomingii]